MLARYLIDHHAVTEARARGWGEVENGELLTVAEAAGLHAAALPKSKYLTTYSPPFGSASALISCSSALVIRCSTL
jgi:hypothetical protein